MSGATGVLAWLDSLHETTADGAATNRKWSEAQEARATVERLMHAAEQVKCMLLLDTMPSADDIDELCESLAAFRGEQP